MSPAAASALCGHACHARYADEGTRRRPAAAARAAPAGPLQRPRSAAVRAQAAPATPHAAPLVSPQEIASRLDLAKQIDRLDLADCGLTELPPEVLKLHALRELSLAGNHLTELPEGIAELQQLTRLGLAGNQLRTLPASLGRLESLQGLWLNGNLLEELPDSIEDLQELTTLALSGNRLRELPEAIGRLWKLTAFGVAGNYLETLPAAFCDLCEIRSLSAHGNRLRSLPANFGEMTSLEEVWLHGNLLERLPEGWGGLKKLRQLSLADNRLTQLPASFTAAPALAEVLLYGNRLQALPAELACMPKLHALWVEGNPLEPAGVARLLGPLNRVYALGLDAAQVRGLTADQLKVAGSALRLSESLGGTDADGHALPGYFKLVRGPSDAPVGERALVVSFGSAPGTPNWAGLLKRVRALMVGTAGASAAAASFDVLFVVDPARSWYTEAWAGATAGTPREASYEARLARVTAPYGRVMLLGDSMGATAALLFSELATSVLAFCPQVSLAGASMRPGQDQAALASFRERLCAAVGRSQAREVSVHTGQWQHDVAQAEMLPQPKASLMVHPVDSHRVAAALDAEGDLVPLVAEAIIRMHAAQ